MPMVIDQTVSADGDVSVSDEAYADLIIFCCLHTTVHMYGRAYVSLLRQLFLNFYI